MAELSGAVHGMAAAVVQGVAIKLKNEPLA